MIDPGLKGKTALITGGNNPYGIGAAIARTLASNGVRVFIHYYRRQEENLCNDNNTCRSNSPGLDFFMKQQAKTADEVLASIRDEGGVGESWEGDLRVPENAGRLFDEAQKKFGSVDILVNNAAEYTADTFLPNTVLGGGREIWNEGPAVSTIDDESYLRHFAVNTRTAAILMRTFAARIIENRGKWGRIINISADCASGSPMEVSYRASKYALESYSRSAAAELGPHGITVNVVSPGPVQSGYIPPDSEKTLIAEIPLRRLGRPEDVANAVLFLASEQAAWITGQLLFVHGGHRMAFGLV